MSAASSLAVPVARALDDVDASHWKLMKGSPWPGSHLTSHGTGPIPR